MASKNPVGDVYGRVIKEVCEQSRIDFEEGGVELTTLDLLQSEWQKKLSQLKVAQLPWDPTPTPAPIPTPSRDTTLPSNVRLTAPPPPTANGNVTDAIPQSTPALPTIKQETQSFQGPTAQQQPYNVSAYRQGQSATAQERAAINLKRTYGDRAGAQIAELQQSASARMPLSQQIPHQVDFIKQEDQKSPLPSLDEYQGEIHQPPAIPIKSSQNDGASDWKEEYARRKALISAHRGGSDRLMREHFLSLQQQLEGGGLMLPLDERHIPTAAMRHSIAALQTSESDSSRSTDKVGSSLSRAQADATGDDDDEDENAINSDLDDPDELEANEQDGENTDQVMLCTFDKVQRVKNKWKCILKDGVLRVDGNDYVFHKGQGEFEW